MMVHANTGAMSYRATHKKASSAPPDIPIQSSIKHAMRIDEVVNHNDKESDDIAEKAAKDAVHAVEALLRLGGGAIHESTESHRVDLAHANKGISAFPPTSSPQADTLSILSVTQHSESLLSGTEPSLSPEHYPLANTRAESASSYAPSATPAAGAATDDDIASTAPDHYGISAIQDDDEDDEAGGDPNNREFTCWVHPDCQTKQYTLVLSRKMVSDYFGRNKKETQHVEEARWIRACRKHYQRKSYQDSWRSYKGRVVVQQLRKIADQRPGLRFKVTLKSSEEKRLSDYLVGLSMEGRLFDANALEARRKDDKNPDRAPVAVLAEIKQFVAARSSGGDKVLSAGDCEELVERAIQMVRDERCIRLPLFEMLPQFTVGRASPKGAKGKKANGNDDGTDTPRGMKRKGGSASSAGGSSAKRQKV